MSDAAEIRELAAYNFHGSYDCLSDGQKYKYYGIVYPWSSSKYEAFLYRADKKFRCDGIYNSKDVLIIFHGQTVNMQMDGETLKSLAIGQVERQIETWSEAK